jgi:hypothetical protein
VAAVLVVALHVEGVELSQADDQAEAVQEAHHDGVGDHAHERAATERPERHLDDACEHDGVE